jgi:hypothetical protein
MLDGPRFHERGEAIKILQRRRRSTVAEIIVRLLIGEDEEKSFFLSQEFSSEVARLNGLISRAPAVVTREPGVRGDPVTLGAIAIAAVSAGALTGLVNTIGSYLTRDRRTEVEIQTHDGRKVRVSSQAFKPKELEELLQRSLEIGDK